jgi:hypothetical protein
MMPFTPQTSTGATEALAQASKQSGEGEGDPPDGLFGLQLLPGLAVAGTGPASFTPPHAASQSLPYTRPSVPHTGSHSRLQMQPAGAGCESSARIVHLALPIILDPDIVRPWRCMGCCIAAASGAGVTINRNMDAIRPAGRFMGSSTA